jgi:transposase InsO family protein
MPLIQNISMKMPRLGTKKLYYLLKQGIQNLRIKIGRDGFNAYLKSHNMLVKPKKNYIKTTNSSHWLRKHLNLLKDNQVQRAEQFFVSDITYIKSRQKTHYLSLVTDAYTRKIMGFKHSDDMQSRNVDQALKMAIKTHKNNNQLIHHSDRGVQYCSDIYQTELKKNNILPSMTDGYYCYQNALAKRI